MQAEIPRDVGHGLSGNADDRWLGAPLGDLEGEPTSSDDVLDNDLEPLHAARDERNAARREDLGFFKRLLSSDP